MADTDNIPANGGGGDIAQDVVITDRELFDSSIAPEPSKDLSATEVVEAPAPEPTPAQRQRDEQGRFAPQPQTPAPRQQQQPQQAPPQQGQPGELHNVPLRTYLEEREARYRAQAEADQVKQYWDRLQQEQEQQRLAQMRQQLPQTIYDNPEMYLVHNVINPLRQEGHMMMLQIKDGMSRSNANYQYGADKVDAALQAMAQVRATPQGDFVFRQIMSDGHPYAALVQWHHNVRQSQQIRQRLTADPDGKKYREQLLNDPRFRAEAVKREQAQRQQQRGGPPNVQLPPSLSTMPASSGRGGDQGDMSDESLFKFATS